ncbi:hypothetical protein CPB84DRAFT_1779309 [Gymnopilus junonius]|uniref:Uncharacterized protein n=1 Tax=Gymnopilus junonius TaxID=109634 RepID=A0A9P5NNM9_GYMJU|nr:hypothetical protein CPB84DRAFT_1779309 [Gymnopilus junonius]
MDGTKQEYAYYPLTLFDGMMQGTGVTTGWFVEGLLDLGKIDAALRRLVSKWQMLAGRLQYCDVYTYQVKVPLGPLPHGYNAFSLTSRVSSAPITDFLKLPLPFASDVLPNFLFLDPSAPNTPDHWHKNQLPLTYWHLTYFKQPGQEYTCIGVTFPHGLLDGMGIAAVVHALESETLGRPWSVPPALTTGENENKLQLFLDRTSMEVKNRSKNDYHAVSIIGIWFILNFVLWHLWQQLWHKAHRRLILLPPKVYGKLVDDARNAMARDGKVDFRLSTGDVLAAWIFKTVYSQELNQSRRVSLSNQASLRMFSDANLGQYAHNCFIPIPYPLFTVEELKATPVHTLAYKLASARSSLSIGHAIEVYNSLQECVRDSKSSFRKVLPIDLRADESMSMSNMSIARIVDIDWTGAGGGKTICRYKELITGSPILISNIVTIAGRLHDGSTVLDVVLNSKRMKVLEGEVGKLIKAAE